MIGEVLAALVGRELDESNPDAGALLGLAAEVVLKRAIPLMLLGGGLLVARHYVQRWAESD